jgi:hypothetical protein
MKKKPHDEHPERRPHRGRRRLVTLIPGDLALEHPAEVAVHVFRQVRRQITAAEGGDVRCEADAPDLDQRALREIATRDLVRRAPAGPGSEDDGGAA